jgi:hypothetical protein
VSQPYKRGAQIPQPGILDPKLKEFWVDNPWEIAGKKFNLSSFERNRLFLNRAGNAFLDLSSIAGVDTDGDGRSVVAGDFRNNGRMEVILRQVNGTGKSKPFMLYENNFPQRHYLHVSLRGTKSNSLGIGARLTAYTKDQKVVRELYPANSFRSQGPTSVHFGLGDASKVDKLVIRWPGQAGVQEIHNLDVDQHILVTEGQNAVETIVPVKH